MSQNALNIVLARIRLYLACKWARLGKAKSLSPMSCNMMGLTLPSPIGIAAGMDKSGWLTGLVPPSGFGFVEIGSVRPDTLKDALGNLRRTRNGQGDRHGHDIVGVNISCGKDAEGTDAIEHYVRLTRACLPFADYLVINLSSPCNVRARAGGREWLQALFMEVAAERDILQTETSCRKPLAVKVVIDACRDETALESLWFARRLNFDGAIVATSKDMPETEVCDILRTAKAIIGDMALISVGGIMSAEQMLERMKNSAVAVQLFTGIVEYGPTIARQMLSRSAPVFRSFGTVHKGVS